ncbi:sugar phosphate isomerase/epimerase family protein [Poritiphilus flavus]|uniref:TIM barrel protein n=1 Tax=Poritiphilus flavus TaxID=2697053 RepID=A0A6L9EF75_9FLAO|nr:sugar phosphate isomerase/epimerase family protein [Poritiphilus flavus]NAS13303.1 TIM barrel protein [Poritiphilus flavus]
MKFGASSWPFQWDPPYENVIKRISGLGFKAIELIAWNPGFLKDYYTTSKVKELRAILSGEGLELSQFVFSQFDLSHPEPDKRKSALEDFKQAADIGLELGTKIINSVSAWPFGMRFGEEFPWHTHKPLVQLFTAPMPRGLNWDGNYKSYVAAVQACADHCEANGLFHSIEPHPYAYVANTSGALRLFEHVDSDALCLNFDPSHLFPVGDFPNVSVYQLGNRIKHLHVSDNDAVTNVHWRPGQGKIDWKEMFIALKETGFDGVVSIELEDVPGVSRGGESVPGVYRNPVATEDFARESVLGMKYLQTICDEIGLDYE